MKVKAPEGVTSCSHNGVQYDVGKDGTFEVDDHAHHTHAHFREQGFEMVESDEFKAKVKAEEEAAAKAAAEAKEAAEKAAAEKAKADAEAKAKASAKK